MKAALTDQRDKMNSEGSKQTALIPGLAVRGFDSLTVLQNRICFGMIAVAILLLICPPWYATAPNGMSTSIGHYFVFSSTPSENYKFAGLDYARFLFEVIGVAAVAAVAIFLVRPAIKTS